MTDTQALTPIEILLVDDNPADVRLTLEALREDKIYNNVHVVGDGEEALAFLRRQGKFSNALRPDLVLLDLNLPKIGGREVLEEVKSDDALKSIPVVVLTVSKSEEDILKSYNLHANCFITKPVDLEKFSKVAKSVQEFWMTIVKLPPRAPQGHNRNDR
ncbi:response regulator [Candidatus Sumerlaeota bacterium]|nr:response regulator [Candidatus Sumerlaeota bacterium]